MVTSLRWHSTTTSSCSETFGSDCSHKCEQSQIVNTGCWKAVVEDSCWRPGTPKAPFCSLPHFDHGHPSTPGCRHYMLTCNIVSYAHNLVQPYWTHCCEYVRALSAQHPDTLPPQRDDPLPLHKESLALSAEALSNTMLWIILSSGKANRILPFILVLFVLAARTVAPPIPFPTINTVSASLTLLYIPFTFALSSLLIQLVFPLYRVISTVYTKLLC